MDFTPWRNRMSAVLLTEAPVEIRVAPLVRLAGPETLVLACSEPCLNGALSAFAPGQASIVRTFGNRLGAEAHDFNGSSLATLPSGVRNVTVVGHSCCSWAQQQVTEIRPAACRDGMDRILWNVRRAQRVKTRAMQNIVEQLEALRRIPAVAEAIGSGRLALHGWLYLDETGLFMRYDDELGCFEPAAAAS